MLTELRQSGYRYTGIIDFKDVSEKYAEILKKSGGEILFNEKVIKINETSSSTTVESNMFTKQNFS